AELEPSAASQCLGVTPGARAEPEYPFMQYKSGAPGRVKVALDFGSNNTAPAVTVLDKGSDSDFEDAVTRHARDLRVPCLPAGTRVRLLREYVFQTERRVVHAGPTVDADDTRRGMLLTCQQHVGGSQRPEYPKPALRRALQGRVLASLRFEAADRPPVVQLHALPQARELAEEVERWVAGLRLPCLQGDPISSTAVFIFRIEGEIYGFRPLTLQQFMAATTNIDKQHLQFDTTQMGCPFDIKLTYRQPFMRNAVGTVGDYDAARHALMEWLRNAQLDMSRNSLASVFGDTAEIRVPCAKFDLKPKEKQT
ncbi:MAG: hypothetical protein WAQ05_15605, partial [Rubrivivax sp.]